MARCHAVNEMKGGYGGTPSSFRGSKIAGQFLAAAEKLALVEIDRPAACAISD